MRFDKAPMVLQSVRPQISPPFQIRRLERLSFARNFRFTVFIVVRAMRL